MATKIYYDYTLEQLTASSVNVLTIASAKVNGKMYEIENPVCATLTLQLADSRFPKISPNSMLKLYSRSGVTHQQSLTRNSREASNMTEAIICAIIAALSAVSVGVINYHSQKVVQKELKDELERTQRERQKREQDKEQYRKEFELFIIRGLMATITLSEATAKAVQRIPDTHCNGDMTRALEEEAKVKKDIQDFLARQGVDNIIN